MKGLKDKGLEGIIILCQNVIKLANSRDRTACRGFEELVYSTRNDIIKDQIKNTLMSLLLLLVYNYGDEE